MLELTDGQTLCILGDDENADALCACLGIGLGHDQVVVCNAGVGDPCLAAVENVAAVSLLCSNGFDSRSVRASVGFGQAECKDFALGCEGEVMILLLLGAVYIDHVGCQPVSVKEQSDRSAALCYLVDDDLAHDCVTAAAAVLLGEVNTHQACFAQLLVNAPVKTVFVHPLVTGLDLVFGEFSYHVADHDLLFCELEHFLQAPFQKIMCYITVRTLWDDMS